VYTLEKLKKELLENINSILELKDVVLADIFEYPPNQEMGDLSLPCFLLAKEKKQAPGELANNLLTKIGELNLEFLEGIKTVGPYLNFSFKKDFFVKELLKEVGAKKDNYGKSDFGQNKKVMIEYSNANTHKEYHIGHLRNLFYGDSVNRILSASGYESISVSYINDFGIHVAKTLWAYLTYRKDEKIPANRGRFLGETYVMATQKLTENQMGKGMTELMMKKIESRKGEEFELWQKTREWSIEQFSKIYDELGIKFENIFYESDLIEEGKALVKELKEKNILRESEGAVIADLEEYGLGVLVIIRSDGTATYPVADIPLAKKKFEDFNLDTSIYVVDTRQSLYFKQLFKILELLGHKEKMIHLGYEFVNLPSGMISSRSGNTIPYEDLKFKLMERSIAETQKRHPEWEIDRIEFVAQKISKGAMKFEMVKVGADQIITFDIDKALDFSGFTAAYIQYAVARINSLIRKSKNNEFSQMEESDDVVIKKEKQLVLKALKYSEIIQRASIDFDPSEIAKYIFELSQNFNDYYHSVPILKAKKEDCQKRLELLRSIKQIISNGLDLLGIEIVDEM